MAFYDLASLGIEEHRQNNGKSTFTIQLDNKDADSSNQTAVYNSQRKIWEILPVTSAIDAQSSPITTGAREDWTDTLPSTPHTDFFRNVDWDNSPLGSLSQWPHCLRLYTQMLWSESRPAAIYWGPQRIAIYNEPCVPILGAVHPALMAHSFEEILPAPWEVFGPVIRAVETEHTGRVQRNLMLPSYRNDYREETYWDGGIFALKDDQNNHGGLYFSWIETTRIVLRDRRMTLITALGQFFPEDSAAIWQHVHSCLEKHALDVPGALLYSTDDPVSSPQDLSLRFTIGVKADSSSTPSKLNLASPPDLSPLAKIFTTTSTLSPEVLFIDTSTSPIDQAFLDDFEWLGYGEPSRYFAFIPLHTQHVIRGYLLLALNPRRALDDENIQFVHDLSRQINSQIARLTSREEAQALEARLTKDLREQETRVRRLVDMVLVGIFEFSPAGEFSFVNPQTWEILGVPVHRQDISTFRWEEWIHPDSIPECTEALKRCEAELIKIGGDIKLNRLWYPPATALDIPPPPPEPFWIKYATIPEKQSPDGPVVLKGYMVDVSHLKWTQKIQKELAEKSSRERQKLEEFIDFVSHELRNPLSAIVQSADGIASSLGQMTSSPSVEELKQELQSNIDAADVILHCSQHQQRIVDDVLILGKLNSGIALISPVPFDPAIIVRQASQMFGKELQSADIEFIQTVDQNDNIPTGQHICADPSRTLQVVINLMTNSIKFTRVTLPRRITLRYGIMSRPPDTKKFGPGFRWSTADTNPPDLVDNADPDDAPTAYCYFAVEDTGVGIPAYAQRALFSRFSQGDKRTHIKYGGSGLGLHICKELAERQGGQIGLQSVEGEGSMFGFYIKAKLADQVQTPSLGRQDAIDPKGNLPRGLQSGRSDTASAGQVQPSDLSILLVEDNVINQKVLAGQLRKAGCSVALANHGGESIDYILSLYGRPRRYDTSFEALTAPVTRPHCILMDWEMPVCDGLRATQQIREIERQLKQPAVMIVGVTANARTEQKEAAVSAGMNFIVAKPFKTKDLLDQIHQALAARNHNAL